MTVVITDDQTLRLRPSGVDRDGVAVPAASLANLNVTIDNPAVASIEPDSANPGAWLLTPLAAPAGTTGSHLAQVTFADPATGLSTITPVEIDPGAELALQVGTEILTDPASTGGSASQPSNTATATAGTPT